VEDNEPTDPVSEVCTLEYFIVVEEPEAWRRHLPLVNALEVVVIYACPLLVKWFIIETQIVLIKLHIGNELSFALAD